MIAEMNLVTQTFFFTEKKIGIRAKKNSAIAKNFVTFESKSHWQSDRLMHESFSLPPSKSSFNLFFRS